MVGGEGGKETGSGMCEVFKQDHCPSFSVI